MPTKKKHASTRDWTRDLQIFSLTLSRLSYKGNYRVPPAEGKQNFKNYVYSKTLLLVYKRYYMQ